MLNDLIVMFTVMFTHPLGADFDPGLAEGLDHLEGVDLEHSCCLAGVAEEKQLRKGFSMKRVFCTCPVQRSRIQPGRHGPLS